MRQTISMDVLMREKGNIVFSSSIDREPVKREQNVS